MTSITWTGPRCVQELVTILAPQNRIQGRCDIIQKFRIQIKNKTITLLYSVNIYNYYVALPF